MTATQPTDYMRPKEAAPYLRVSDRTLARMMRQGKIPFIRAGRRVILFKKSEIDKAMNRFSVGVRA